MNIPKSYEVPLQEDGDLKHDAGKLRYDLIPPETLKGLASVLTYGSIKYADWNWIKSEKPERYYGAMLRHLESDRSGEKLDPESGLPHLEHVLFCAMALHWLSTVKGVNMKLPYSKLDTDHIPDAKKRVGAITGGVLNRTWQPPQWVATGTILQKDADAQP